MSIRQEEVGCANYEYIVNEESMKGIKAVLERIISCSDSLPQDLHICSDVQRLLKEIPEMYLSDE